MSFTRASYCLVIDSAANTELPTAEQLDCLYRKLTCRLMPVFCMCIMLNYLDRTSLAFASIQMTQQLQFSPEVLGLGGGLFFLSYCVMQVPSNIICMRIGVTRWLSGIMLCWGIVAALFAAVQVRWQFYVLRLLLGLAEAGTFPAVWYGISLWFPPTRTSLPFALVTASVAVSQIVAAPAAAALLRLDGTAGLAGWQWVFLGEGLPSVALALMLPCLLPGGPGKMHSSNLLSQEELQILCDDRELRMEPWCTKSSCQTGTAAHADIMDTAGMQGVPDTGAAAARSDLPAAHQNHITAAVGTSGLPQNSVLVHWRLLLRVMKIWQVWVLACCESVKVVAVLALMLWLPVMVQSILSGGDPTQLVSGTKSSAAQHSAPDGHSGSDSTGTLSVLLTAIPFTCSAVLTTSLGALAQRTGRPLVLFFTANFIGGTALFMFSWVVHKSRVAGFVMLTVALACGHASSPMPVTAIAQIVAGKLAEPGSAGSSSQLLSQTGVQTKDAQVTALALPMYNTVAMLGGFFGPWLLGVAVERFGGFSAGAIAMGLCMLAAGSSVLLMWCLHKPTAATGLYAHAFNTCNSLRSRQAAGCMELSQQVGGNARDAQMPSHAATGRGLSSSGSRGREAAAVSGRQQSLRTKGASTEHEQLLHSDGGGGSEGVDAVNCVAHDAELPVRREGSSPRVRLQRGRPASS